jgi:hypothetical protein
MQKYIIQLLEDIGCATEDVRMPFIKKEPDLYDWISDEEEDKTAPVRNLEEWTGISTEMLPPAEMLNDGQVLVLLEALKKMLDAYNWSFVLQTSVPERIQYETIRNNFHQEAKVKRWHMGFFELCSSGAVHKKCTLGAYCQCAFYAELFSGFSDEELSPEEERARELEIEIKHLKNKYGDEWMKYYPYHLDKNADDVNGNCRDYGFEDDNFWD